VAIFFGYGTATAFNYFVNYYWSFASASPHQRAAFRYGIIVIAGLIWNTLVVELSMFLGVPLTLALLLGVFSWPLLSFVALRFWALPPSPAG
jgi:putative flippase GtrA